MFVINFGKRKKWTNGKFLMSGQVALEGLHMRGLSSPISLKLTLIVFYSWYDGRIEDFVNI